MRPQRTSPSSPERSSRRSPRNSARFVPLERRTTRRSSTRIASSEAGTAPWARAWTSTLPSAVASTGPASTGTPAASAVSWQSSCVLRAAADDVDRRRRRVPASVGRPLDGPGVRRRPASRGCSAVVSAGGHGRAARPRAAIRVGHAARRDERRVVDVDDRTAGGQLGGRGEEVVEVVALATPAWHSCSSHSPPTLRRKRVRPSTPPSLVKLAARAASVRTGAGELEADERPRAAGDVGEAVGRGGDADDGRGGVVRADRRTTGGARPAVARRAPRPVARAAAAGRPGCRAGRAARLDHCRGAGVEQAGRRRVGQLGAQLAGEPVGEQVGEQHDVGGAVPSGRCAARRRAGRAC